MELVLIDTAKIQSYIFASNRLREQIGASHLVASATTSLILKSLSEARIDKHNVAGLKESGSLKLTDDNLEQGLDVETIYAGGGNAALLFKEERDARRFRRMLTTLALLWTPGITLFTDQCTVDDPKQLGMAYKELRSGMSKTRAERKPSIVPKGLSVTRWDAGTGQPAVTQTPEGAYVSAETRAKIEAVKNAFAADGAFTYQSAITRLENFLPLQDGYSFPLEFDHLGRSMGSHSYIAIVHADADGLGRRLDDFIRSNIQQDKESFIWGLRGFSQAIDRASQAALKMMYDRLTSVIIERGDSQKGILHFGPTTDSIEIPLHRNPDTNTWDLPFRPIVFGGDDITFAADGRIGIALARTYIDAFAETSETELKEFGGAATASTGICIVKTHYPFARAYAIAEELTAGAKAYRRSLQRAGAKVGGCLDWHFATSGLAGDLEAIRAKTLEPRRNELLYLRPVTAGVNPALGHNHRAWPFIEKSLTTFQAVEGVWSQHRSKMKDLLIALRKGPAAVRTFRQANPNLPLPVLSLGSDIDDGWLSERPESRCLFYDALELADWYVPINSPEAPVTVP